MLAHLPDTVLRPGYDPRAVSVGMVHLGLGNFHRAHQAVYTDAILAKDPRWGICGVSLKSRGAVDSLRAQDHLYTVVVKDAAGAQPRIIGSICEAHCGGDDMPAVIARMAAPTTRIVSLTITEKGYCHDPATGRLNLAHPDIAHDVASGLATGHAPRSAPGAILMALQARKSLAPTVSGRLTILSCDNLPHNGKTLGALMHELAAATDPSLATWMRDNVSFPSTMVDRIVPATTAQDIAETARLIGTHDAVPVVTEPFAQWVIEDVFAADRPAWEEAGAQFVADVAPFELMKLRLLNAAHSAMAYLGYLAGHEFIYQASADPLFVRMVERLWSEVGPTLPALPTNVENYQRDLMARFRNTALPHRTWQIAMDGSQKLPQRILASVRECLAAGAPFDTLALVVAGWMRYVSGADENGQPINVRDPLAAELARIADRTHGVPAALCDSLFALEGLFGADLPTHERFVQAVRRHLESLFRNGARATLAAVYCELHKS